MKKLLLLSVLGLCLCVIAHAQQLNFQENFNGMTTGNLGSQDGWVPFLIGSGSANVQVVNTAPLIYPGYGSAGNYATIGGGNDPYKAFSSPVPTATDTSLWTAFLVNSASAASGSCAEFSVALRSDNGVYLSRFNMYNNNGHLHFGISKGNYGNGQVANAATGNLTFNTTYLILIRYDIKTTGSDSMYLWVNPSLVGEPAIDTADASATDSDPLYGSQVDALQLSQSGGQCTAPHAAFDDIRVSTTWDGLFGTGGPLATTVSALKATQKTNGVLLDWSNYAETNINHYEIERSADGHLFKTIGRIDPKSNQNIKVDYSWLDESPINSNNYYRIKFVSNAGRTDYSTITRISISKLNTDLVIYPNPVKGLLLSIQVPNLEKGMYSMKVFNNTGALLYTQQFQHQGAAVNQSVQLPANFKTGIDNLQLSGTNQTGFHKTFMVQ